ncbi:MAG: relaxase domain-containing protein, partial [Actinomycetia bacterium]|nr:relaxase domain-containing protein [Actinomycetes bacterium]
VHVVVANMGTTSGGKVQALDGRGLFAEGTTAGHLAEAEIQSILNQQGYRFTPTENGIAHLEQIPQEAVDAFSTRRTQILEEVGALGIDSPAARQNAAYATRAAKVDGVDRQELERTWRRTLAANGMTPEQLRVARSHDAPLLWTPADTDRLDRFLTSSDGVTRATGVFDRRDVIHSITDHTGGRLNAQDVQAHADRWLATDAVIPLRPIPGSIGHDFIGRSGRVALAPGTIHYTTPQVVATELAITEAYTAGLNRGTGVAARSTVGDAIAGWEASTGHQLGSDQVAMVRSITTSGHQFQAVVGPAGSGKTAALEVAARAWEKDGFTVVGASVNGNAAEFLARSTGLPTRTVASLLERLRYDETLAPGPTRAQPL